MFSVSRCFIKSAFIFGSLLFLWGCAPVFSELQSARTIGKGNVELTPSYSSAFYSESKETEKLQNHFGGQLAYGLSERLDFRLRYDYIRLHDDNTGGTSVFGGGLKYNVIRDKLSIYIPIGRAINNENFDAWQVHPTVLFSWPIKPQKIEYNLSAKYLLLLCENCDNYLAFNTGLSLSKDLSSWTIRPEFGILLGPGENGFVSHLSLGVSKVF